MLMSLAGVLIALPFAGIIGGVGYYRAHKTAQTILENLNSTTDQYRLTSEQSLMAYQNQLKKIARSNAARLKSQRHKQALELSKLRDAYEQQLARFQSSVTQLNGRMASNQETYQKELERLRTVYSTLRQRHAKLEGLINQGWSPRMVTLPVQPGEATSGSEQKDSRQTPEYTGSISSRKLQPSASDPKPDPNSPAKQSLRPASRANPQASAITSVDVASLKSSMQALWKKQNRTSSQINFSARKRVKEMVQVLSRLKFNLSELKLASNTNVETDTGGPFVELAFADIAATSKKSGNIDFAALQPFRKIFLLEKALLELPIRRPLSDMRSITSSYGPRMDPFRKIYAMHRGIDFRAPKGEPVLATAAGVVVMAKNSKSGYGKVLVIRHKHGITTLYGHLSAFTVKAGDRVKPGDVVGKVGNTGRSTGPHLHYEVRVGDSHVDPIDYLEAATYVF